ncbi:hypothetical protein KR044_008673 [Drosophila immigrans]|nr:hypothetical protein KR044_008673 [Drosophila immigrans]
MKLEAELEHARNERETEMLRKELKQREADSERLKLELQMRQNQSQQLVLPIRHKSYLHAPIRRFGRKRATGSERLRNYAHDARNNIFSFNNIKNSIIQIRQYQD